MVPDKPDLLDAVSEMLANGKAVDWDRCERESDSEEARRWLRNLRVVSEVGRIAREAAVAPALGGGTEATHLVPSVEPEPNAAETPWGPLKLLEQVGLGGFGEVYRAWDTRLHRQVALKMLRPEFSADPRWREKMLAEARMLARVEHPNVARIYGIEDYEGRTGLWMELVDGTDLQRLVEERGALGADETARIGRDVCKALAAVHAANLVHQDVKANNIMQESGGRVVLMDFGAGSRRQRTSPDEIRRSLTGTPLYMAPELFAGGAPTPQSDIYSVGVLLFFLVTGKLPVQATTVRDLAQAHRAQAQKRLGEVRPDLPASFTRVVERAMASSREARFATAGEMAAALEASLTAPARKGVRRSARAPWLAGAGLAGVAAIVAMVLLRSGGSLSAQVRYEGIVGGEARELRWGDAVSEGDAVRMVVDPTRTAHVYVLNLDTSGNVVVLEYPAPGESDPVEPGARRLPGPGPDGKERYWTLGGDAGVESFYVVASAERLVDFEKALEGLPTLDAGGGLRVKPVSTDAVVALTRGVKGMVSVDRDPAAPEGMQDLRALLRDVREADEASDRLWFGEMTFKNQGPRPDR